MASAARGAVVLTVLAILLTLLFSLLELLEQACKTVGDRFGKEILETDLKQVTDVLLHSGREARMVIGLRRRGQ
jgi:hypothetical protein